MSERNRKADSGYGFFVAGGGVAGLSGFGVAGFDWAGGAGVLKLVMLKAPMTSSVMSTRFKAKSTSPGLAEFRTKS